MTAYQRGELSAFAELVARHEKPLWNFLRRFVRDGAAAEDLLQETFLRVVRGAAEWKPSAKFSTWLYTIGRNVCVDYLRSSGLRANLSLDGAKAADGPSVARLHDRIAGNEPGGEARALNRELGLALERAIRGLPELQREVFLMREVMELPFAEIAAAVGASEATVKSRMRYALERLRDELEAQREGALDVAVLP